MTAPLTVMIFTLCARIGGEALIVDVGLSDLLGDEAITLCIGLVVRGLVLVPGRNSSPNCLYRQEVFFPTLELGYEMCCIRGELP